MRQMGPDGMQAMGQAQAILQEETRDFGVPAPTQLHHEFHAPTPNSIPGGGRWPSSRWRCSFWCSCPCRLPGQVNRINLTGCRNLSGLPPSLGMRRQMRYNSLSDRRYSSVVERGTHKP